MTLNVQSDRTALLFIRDKKEQHEIIINVPKFVARKFDAKKNKYTIMFDCDLNKYERIIKHKINKDIQEMYLTISDDPNAHFYPSGGLSMGYITINFAIIKAKLLSKSPVVIETNTLDYFKHKLYLPPRIADDTAGFTGHNAINVLFDFNPKILSMAETTYLFKPILTDDVKIISKIKGCDGKNLFSYFNFKPTSVFNPCVVQHNEFETAEDLNKIYQDTVKQFLNNKPGVDLNAKDMH